MARVNTISDGQPLTYDILNQIISEVNKIKDVPEDYGMNVEVYGPDMAGTSDQDTAKIISGTYQFDIKEKDTTVNLEIPYGRGAPFSKDNVIVVASVVDKFLGKGTGGVQMANVTITGINKTKFEARVQILKSVKQKVALQLNYIAIGAGPRATG